MSFKFILVKVIFKHTDFFLGCGPGYKMCDGYCLESVSSLECKKDGLDIMIDGWCLHSMLECCSSARAEASCNLIAHRVGCTWNNNTCVKRSCEDQSDESDQSDRNTCSSLRSEASCNLIAPHVGCAWSNSTCVKRSCEDQSDDSNQDDSGYS